MRQRILYADVMWEKMRFWPFLLMAAGIVAIGFYYGRLRQFDSNTLVWVLYVISGFLLLAALLAYRRRSYVEVTESGFRVGTLFSALTIDFESIRGARVQPLEDAFVNRRRYINRYTTPLLKRPTLFLRLKGTDEELASIRRKLGARYAYEDTVAIPVPDAQAAATAVLDRLPKRGLQPNLGGGRRGKRRR